MAEGQKKEGRKLEVRPLAALAYSSYRLNMLLSFLVDADQEICSA